MLMILVHWWLVNHATSILLFLFSRIIWFDAPGGSRVLLMRHSPTLRLLILMSLRAIRLILTPRGMFWRSMFLRILRTRPCLSPRIFRKVLTSRPISTGLRLLFIHRLRFLRFLLDGYFFSRFGLFDIRLFYHFHLGSIPCCRAVLRIIVIRLT